MTQHIKILLAMTNSLSSLPNLLNRLWCHLSERRRREFAYLFGLMLLSALAEIISFGAVLPFLGVLVSPEEIFKRPIIMNAAKFFGISTTDQLLFFMSATFIVAALFAGTIRMLLLRVSSRVVFASGADLSSEVYRRSLYQPYEVHIARNSSKIISVITIKLTSVVFGVMQPLMTFVSSIVLLIAITVALFAINPIIAAVAGVGFLTIYGIVIFISRKRLQRNSQRIASKHSQVIKILQEGLSGIRDVLLENSQKVYYNLYSKADQPFWRAQGENVFIAGSPRFIIETLGLVIITCLAYSLSRQSGGVATALPLLGALAFGAQRLLPTLQNIYSSWASIVGSKSSLVDVITLLDQPIDEELLKRIPEPLAFEKCIKLKAIYFRYGNDGPWVIDGTNLEIQKGARVGFIGRTGSGKSTLLDLLMGLLMPTAGEILVDGKTVSGHSLRAWQRNIAHVPQSIYLADATFAENIAFGVLPEAIDLGRVRTAAIQAQIANYIENQPDGYCTVVGERGIRLSGGQRQRIGIARALYKHATVLVLDEATSALDNSTEQSVMDAIKGLNRDLTILIVAHRLSTLQQCDTVVELVHGKLVLQHAHNEIIGSNTDIVKISPCPKLQDVSLNI